MTTNTIRGNIQIKENTIFNEDWIDYSDDSTIIGWSSFIAKQIAYKRAGKLIFVKFRLAGTSDSASTSFTVPYSPDISIMEEWTLPTVAMDNGLVVVTSVIYFFTSTISFYKDVTGTTWTASGVKLVRGQFWYQAA